MNANFELDLYPAAKRTEKTSHAGQHLRHFNEIAQQGLAVARKARTEAEYASTPILHVKDGKPLTAHGAKLLGVEWPLR